MRSAAFGPLAAAVLLSSCAALPIPAPAATDRAQTGFDRLSAAAELILPLLPRDREVRARAVLAATAIALAAVQDARSSTDRAAAIAAVDAQLVALRAALHD